ncbi:ABC transporter substrate-binding protein [uncultured Martelella sp.]|uniref:ABC transporter substrate-binding protein n=1 Tax=uncultured Martelella sp. TaxID=392331 RepID=UPI0029C6DEA3|nr:ABC transporter substrate-binding protein [uncultured Martelella sp.]
MKFSRRSILRMSAGSALAVIGAPGIIRAQGSDRPIRFAVAATASRTLDPSQMTLGADYWVAVQIYDMLVDSPAGRFSTSQDDYEPKLAESYDVSEDSKTWTFRLRKGVQFHKGYGEMTAEDVVFSMERAATAGVATFAYKNIDRVEASGTHEVTFHLKGPDPLFLATSISQPTSPIISKKAFEEKGAETFAREPVGTGAYEVDRVDVQKGVFLSRFDDYWDTPARTARVEILYVADTTSRTLSLMSGEVDMIEAVRAPGWIPQIMQQRSDLVVDATDPGSFNTLSFNMHFPLFQDVMVRKAVMTAIDKNQLAQALTPLGQPVATISPAHYPTGWSVDELPEDLRYEYNPDLARQMLADAGHPNGIRFEANISQREDYRSIMLVLQELMRPAGIDMQLNIMDHAAYHQANRTDGNTLALNSQSLPPVPLDYLSRYLASSSEVKSDGSGGYNFSHYGVVTPGVDDLLAAMSQTADYDEYVAIGRKVELKAQDDMPVSNVVNLGYAVIRDPAISLGYEVSSGYARWPLARAVRN